MYIVLGDSPHWLDGQLDHSWFTDADVLASVILDTERALADASLVLRADPQWREVVDGLQAGLVALYGVRVGRHD